MMRCSAVVQVCGTIIYLGDLGAASVRYPLGLLSACSSDRAEISEYMHAESESESG